MKIMENRLHFHEIIAVATVLIALKREQKESSCSVGMYVSIFMVKAILQDTLTHLSPATWKMSAEYMRNDERWVELRAVPAATPIFIAIDTAGQLIEFASGMRGSENRDVFVTIRG